MNEKISNCHREIRPEAQIHEMVEADTVPDDELTCGPSCKLPADLSESDEYYYLDGSSILKLYIAGCLLLLILLLINYLTWRHYAPALASVLNEPVKESGQSSPRRASLPPT